MPENVRRMVKDLRARDAAAREADDAAKAAKRLARQKERRAHQPEEGPNESEAAQWVRNTLEWNEHIGLWELPHASYSDYSGSYIDKANCESFQEMLPDLVEEGFGSHGSTWAGIPEDKRLTISPEDFEQLRDAVNGLEDYPILDEQKLSELEYEAKWEYWQEYGRDGLREALVAKFAGDPDAQIAAVIQDDSFWDTMSSEKGWDQYINEDGAGLNLYMRSEYPAREVARDEIYNQVSVDQFKRHLFFKEGADDFAQALSAAGISFHDNEDLWRLFLEAEARLDVWDVKKRFSRTNAQSVYEQSDKEDAVTLDVKAFPELVQQLTPQRVSHAANKVHLNHPDQHKLPGFESQAICLVQSVLEERPKDVLAALKAAKLKHSGARSDGQLVYLGPVPDNPGDFLCRCPKCGYTGGLMADFSYLAAGFNGIEAGDADDVNLQECPQCQAKLAEDYVPADPVPLEDVPQVQEGDQSKRVLRQMRGDRPKLSFENESLSYNRSTTTWCVYEVVGKQKAALGFVRSVGRGAEPPLWGFLKKGPGEAVILSTLHSSKEAAGYALADYIMARRARHPERKAEVLESGAKRAIQRVLAGARHNTQSELVNRIAGQLCQHYHTSDFEAISLAAAGVRTGSGHEERDVGGLPYCNSCGCLITLQNHGKFTWAYHPDPYLNV